MVSTWQPSTRQAGTTQDLKGSPSIRTVHAPQSPFRHPACVPVFPNVVRRTSSSVVSNRHSVIVAGSPSTVKSVVKVCVRSTRMPAAGPR